MSGIIMGEYSTKIRKRGCSPSSSTTSSAIQGYKFKKAILVGKKGSSTPVPTWRMLGSASPSFILRPASPRYPPSCGQDQPPVSARRLAATLWELNELPSAPPSPSPRRREKAQRSVHSPHLSDPSHTPPASQKRMEKSGSGGNRRGEASVSRTTKMDNYDSRSVASFMEVRSRCQTPSGSSVVGVKTRLKDVSNGLTTSKELLKIISRVRANDDQPSSTLSLISALHSELERARLQINQLIQEDPFDNKDITYLLRRFSEEKAAWKTKEQEVVEAALESVAGELELERKLRRRSESLNKKISKELAETKAALHKSMKELENEKRETRGGEEEEEESTDDEGNSSESDLHSIDVSTQNEDLNKDRKSFVNQVARRSPSILRTASDVEWGNGFNYEIDEQVPRRSCEDEIPQGKAFNQRGPPWPSREPCDGALQRPMMVMERSGMRGSVEECIDEGYHNVRRSRR